MKISDNFGQTAEYKYSNPKSLISHFDILMVYNLFQTPRLIKLHPLSPILLNASFRNNCIELKLSSAANSLYLDIDIHSVEFLFNLGINKYTYIKLDKII